MDGTQFSLHFHLPNNLHRLDADSADALEQVNDGFVVIEKAIRVKLGPDGRVAKGVFFVAVEDPFQGGAVAQAVLPGGGPT